MVVHLRGSLQISRTWFSSKNLKNESITWWKKKMLRFQFQFFTLQGTITCPIPAGTFESMIFLCPRVEYVIVPWMFFQLIEVVKGPRDPGSPKLRMVSWNLNTSHFGGDKKKHHLKKCFCWLTKLFFFGVLEFNCAFFFDSGVLWLFLSQRLRAGLHPQLLGWSFEVVEVAMWDPGDR